jgi:hypothetical protein
MGLDAVVFCDCVEKGRLRVQHPYPRLLYIARNGSPEIRSKDPGKVDQHDKWMDLPPCEHEGMMLPGAYRASANHISHLNRIFSSVLRKHGKACPVLLGKVLYSGTHCGDHLAMRDVRMLSNELDRLKEAILSATALSGEDTRLGASAIRELRELVKIALSTNKPIAF